MAEKKFFVDINLQGNKLVNPVVGSNGSMTTAGSFQYNAGRLEYYNGSTVEEVANLNDIAAVTGGLILQGGYDAATNTPDIAADSSVLKGFFWVVTAAGSFLNEAVQVGDSIIAKQDNPGGDIANWLILQGNVVIATNSVDGISRLATQEEANEGTNGGAVVITPATLQGKIDVQITPEINSKVSKSGDTMDGSLNMGGFNIENASAVKTNELYSRETGITTIDVFDDLILQGATIKLVPTPTDGGDAANKTYVDDNTSNKLPLAGGTMSGNINMANNQLENVNAICPNNENELLIGTDVTLNGFKISNLGAPTNGTNAANKDYVDNAASTAESNANAYTDTAVDALSYTGTLLSNGWSGNVNDGYSFTFVHNLGENVSYSLFYGGMNAEFFVESNNNELTVYSNITPTLTLKAQIIKAGGNL